MSVVSMAASISADLAQLRVKKEKLEVDVAALETSKLKSEVNKFMLLNRAQSQINSWFAFSFNRTSR
jgi:tRNA threonylcarbamoyladenosine modification (KEOPS) complex  Pcc1 subunit